MNDDKEMAEWVASRRASGARAAALSAPDVAPDVMSRANKYARAEGLPPLAVANDIDFHDRKTSLDRVDTIAKESPEMGRWLSRPENVALVRDDLDATSKLGNAIKSMLRVSAPFIPGSLPLQMADRAANSPATTERFQRLYERSQGALAKAVGGTTQMASEVAGAPFDYLRSQLANAQGPGAIALGGTAAPYIAARDEGSRVGSEVFASGAEVGERASEGITRPTSLMDAIKRPGNTFDFYGGMMADSAPAMLATMAGGPVLGLGIMGLSTAGQSYGQFRSEGETEDAALGAAVVQGIIEGAFERIPLAEAFRPGGSFLRRVLRTTGAESGTEALTAAGQDEVESSMLGRTITLQQRLINIIDSSIVGAGMGGPMAAIGAAREIGSERSLAENRRRSLAVLDRIGKVERSTHGILNLERLTAAAAAAKLTERDTDEAEALVKHFGAEGENVYIPASDFNSLFQASDDGGAALAEQLTGSATALAEASLSGDLVIPLAKWVSTVARLPNAKELTAVARMDAEGLSRKDIEGLDIAKEIEAIEGRATTIPAEFTKLVEEQKAGTYAALVSTGLYKDSEADVMATTMGKMVATAAWRAAKDKSKAGEILARMMDRRRVSINGQRVDGSKVEQPGSSADTLDQTVIRLTGFGNPRAREVIGGLRAAHEINPLNDSEIIIGGALVALGQRGGGVWLKSIRARQPGSGQATAALRQVLAAADAAGMDVILDAKAIGDNGLDQKSLVAWYERNGFVETGARDGEMIRKSTSMNLDQLAQQTPAERYRGVKVEVEVDVDGKIQKLPGDAGVLIERAEKRVQNLDRLKECLNA